MKMEDTVKNRTCPKRPFAWYVEKPSAKDYLLTVFIFAVCTLIGLLFQKLDFTDTNIVTIYILGVLITSIVTDGYLCSVAGSFLSVFLFCFFLTEPRMSFETYAVGYPVTFFIMLISSCLLYTSGPMIMAMIIFMRSAGINGITQIPRAALKVESATMQNHIVPRR